MSRAGVICVCVALVLGLPLLGVLLVGEPLGRYLEFPPRTSYVRHEPFSRLVFIALSLLIVTFLGPILFRITVTNHQLSIGHHNHQFLQKRFTLPWWGWLGYVGYLPFGLECIAVRSPLIAERNGAISILSIRLFASERPVGA